MLYRGTSFRTFLNFNHPNSIFSTCLCISLAHPFLSNFQSQAKFTYKACGSKEDNYWLYACLLQLPDLRLHCSVVSTASYLPFSVTAVEREKGHLSSNGYSKVMERLPLVRCGSLSLYCGQKDEWLWWASLHMSWSRETQNVWSKSMLLPKRKICGLVSEEEIYAGPANTNLSTISPKQIFFFQDAIKISFDLIYLSKPHVNIYVFKVT